MKVSCERGRATTNRLIFQQCKQQREVNRSSLSGDDSRTVGDSFRKTIRGKRGGRVSSDGRRMEIAVGTVAKVHDIRD